MTWMGRLIGAVLLGITCLAAACGGDDDSGSTEPTALASPTPGSAEALPTKAIADLQAKFVNEAKIIQTFIEVAGGIRPACANSPCGLSDNPLVNWSGAIDRCQKVDTYQQVATEGTPAAKQLYSGLVAACAKVNDTIKKVSTSTSAADHRKFADEALSGLPALVVGAAGQ